MFNRILLPIDLNHDSSSLKALPTAIEHAKTSGASLHLLTVLPDFGMSIISQYFPDDYEKQVAKKALKELHDFAKKHVPDDINVQHIVGEGTGDSLLGPMI